LLIASKSELFQIRVLSNFSFMKISTSLLPELVWYKQYSDCTVEQALLQSFIDAPDNMLSLPDIGKIKVNGNRLLGSY